MDNGSLQDLQDWVKGRQKSMRVGLLTNNDVKVFWEVQEMLEEAIKNNTDVEAFLYMKPMATWSEYCNDTSYKGPCMVLRWCSSGVYHCERKDPEHKYWDQLNAEDAKAAFWGMLKSNKTAAVQLLDATVKISNLTNEFRISFLNNPNDKGEISVHITKDTKKTRKLTGNTVKGLE